MTGPAPLQLAAREDHAAGIASSEAHHIAAPCTRRAHIVLMGSSLDTGNLGVQALALATLSAMQHRMPNARFTVLGGTPGRRQRTIEIGGADEAQMIVYDELGASLSRNPFKSGNLYVERAMRASRLFDDWGIVGRALDHADLVLDITGGDSFTTMYGPYRWRYATLPKRFALQHRAPVVLLPQTYGPFDAEHESSVRELLSGCAQVWARDAHSANVAAQFIGREAVRTCPDIAFVLPAGRPRGITHDGDRIGVNISGLLYHDAARAQSRFGLRGSYRDLMYRLVTRLLDVDPDARAKLVPHVIAGKRHQECDLSACRDLHASLPGWARDRCVVSEAPASACHAKAIIARCGFFVGTRMHSCIAALSSGVPTTAIAYSDKTRGVFESIGVGSAVADLRTIETDDIIDMIIEQWCGRDAQRATLTWTIEPARRRVNEMFDAVAALVRTDAQRSAA